MPNPSKELRQAVSITLGHARFAASVQKLVSEVDDLMSDEALKDDVSTISRAASAVAVHAWMAMIAMMGDSLDVALNAAQSASEARHMITSLSQKTFLLDLSDLEFQERQGDQIPNERELVEMWNTFRASLPESLSIPGHSNNRFPNQASSTEI